MRPVLDFKVAPRRSAEDGAPAAQARVLCQHNYKRPLIRMGHIPRNYFAETFFDQAFLQWTSNFACLCGRCRGFRKHLLVQYCREKPSKFIRFALQNSTALSMEFFKARMVEVRERG